MQYRTRGTGEVEPNRRRLRLRRGCRGFVFAARAGLWLVGGVRALSAEFDIYATAKNDMNLRIYIRRS